MRELVGMKNMLNEMINAKWNENGFFDHVNVSYGFLHDDEIDNVGLTLTKKDFNPDIEVLTIFNVEFAVVYEGIIVTITKKMTKLDNDDESLSRKVDYYLDNDTIKDIKEEIDFLIKYQLDLDVIMCCRVEKDEAEE